MFNNFFFFENHAYGNVEKCSKGRLAMDDNIIRYMRVACWIIKATNTHRRCCRPAASSVHYTTSCKHSLALPRMGEIIARNRLS